MNLSFWEKEEILRGNQIIVIGAGIVGLCTAIELKKINPEQEVLVLERGNTPSGASTKNAGFACFGSVTEILSDLSTMTEEEVIMLISKRFNGLEKLKSMIDPAAIEFNQFGGYEIFNPDEELPAKDKLDYVNDLIFKAIGVKEVFAIHNQSFGFALNSKLIYNALEGQLNPAKLIFCLYLMAVNFGIRILYNCEVKKLEEDHIFVHDFGEIPFRKLVICTNGFACQLLPFLEVVPARNQVLITEPIQNLRLKGTFHYNEGYVYFRNVGNRILLGGGRNMDKENESTSEFGTSPLIMDYLSGFLFERILPQKNIRIEHWWSGIMGVGSSKETIVTRINDRTFVGVRLGGMGIAIGSKIGEELAKLVMS